MSDPAGNPPPKEVPGAQDSDLEMNDAPGSPNAAVPSTQTAPDGIASIATAAGPPADVTAGESRPSETSSQQNTSGETTSDQPVTNVQTAASQPQAAASNAPAGNNAQHNNIAAPPFALPDLPAPDNGIPTPRQQEAARRFDASFPNRQFNLVPTSGWNLLCGMFAVQTMLRDVPDLPEPTIRELIEIRDAQRARQVAEIFQGARRVQRGAFNAVNNMNMFEPAQLDNVVRAYGQRHHMNLRVGFIDNLGNIDMPGRDNDDLTTNDEYMVWLHLDRRNGGHYSAMTLPNRNRQWIADDYIAVYDEDYLAINLSTGAALLRASFESEGFPESLEGTIAREIDWNTLGNRRNAACWLANTFKRLGLKQKDENSKNKTAKTTTDDDKIFLRGAFLIIEQYGGDMVFGSKPENVWNKTIRNAKKYEPQYDKWLGKQKPSDPPKDSRLDLKFDRKKIVDELQHFWKSNNGVPKDYTFQNPRSMNDKVSITSQQLGDIARCSLGKEIGDRSPERDDALLATGVGVRDILGSGMLTAEGKRNLKEAAKKKEERESRGKGKPTNDDDSDMDADSEADEDDGNQQSEDESSDDSAGGKGLRFTGTQNALFRRYSLSPRSTPPGSRRGTAIAGGGRPSISSWSSPSGTPQSTSGAAHSLRQTAHANSTQSRNVSLGTAVGGLSITPDTPSPAAREERRSSSSNKRPHDDSPDQPPQMSVIEITLRNLRAQVLNARAFVRDLLSDIIYDLQRYNHQEAEALAWDCWRDCFPNENFPARRGSGV